MTYQGKNEKDIYNRISNDLGKIIGKPEKQTQKPKTNVDVYGNVSYGIYGGGYNNFSAVISNGCCGPTSYSPVPTA